MTEQQQPRPTSVLVDGVFDCTHFAHANCLRRAKLFGDEVVAGVHPDADVYYHKKCYPVFSQEERYELVKNLRYCDRTIDGIRYDYDLQDLANHNLDLNAHGDENVISGSGQVLYQDIKAAGRYRVFPRTEGTCTTDVIAEILNHGDPDWEKPGELPQLHTSTVFTDFTELLRLHNEIWNHRLTLKEISSLPTSAPNDIHNDKRVIYTQGVFNIFNVGHLKFLQKAKNLGDFLLVGIVSDRNVMELKKRPPFMSCVQRALNVLSYRQVDAVMLLADDGQIDEKFISDFNISLVCQGLSHKGITVEVDVRDPFNYARESGIFRNVDSESMVTSRVIVDRVLRKRDEFEERNHRKLGQIVAT